MDSCVRLVKEWIGAGEYGFYIDEQNMQDERDNPRGVGKTLADCQDELTLTGSTAR